MKYRLSEIAAVCGARLVGCDTSVDVVVTDSRHSFGGGDRPLFAAIVGAHHDGHSFIDGLYRRGVRGFMVERNLNFDRYPEAGFIVVRRTFRALQALARHHRAGYKGTVIAVTGSRGKTVVKEWIVQAAPEGVGVYRSPRSFNSQLGAALSLLMLRPECPISVIEAGISKPGEMDYLEDMIRPDIGVFTSLLSEHEENFSSPEQKAREKAVLFRGCSKVVYDSSYPEIEEALRRVSPKAELVDAAPLVDSVPFLADGVSRRNAAIVAAVYGCLGYGMEEVAERFRYLQPVDLQLELREGVGDSIIVGDNHNTDINSLSIALDYLNDVSDGRPKVLILSDILFSSMSEPQLYETVAGMIQSQGVGLLIGIGDRIRAHADMFRVRTEFYASVGEFMDCFTQDKVEKCAVLVRGNQMSHFDRIVHMLQRKSHTTVLEVSMDALMHNLAYFRSHLSPRTRLMAMVKAGAYGNGDYEIANLLSQKGVDFLAVAFADEGVALRNKGITMPIVVLNADSDSFDLMVANRLEPEIYSLKSLEAFIQAVRSGAQSSYPIHIKIDSGMHRLGFEDPDAAALGERLVSNAETVVVRSIFSHLCVSDDPSQREFTLEQIRRFDSLSQKIMSYLPYRPLRHINNSAAILSYPESQFDMCRLGIGLYGCCFDSLRQVSRLKTAIVQIRRIAAGESIGYGRAAVTSRPSVVATVPIGYADGLDRHLGCGRWSMEVKGHMAPVIGRICMDSCMIDVTGIDVSEGDTVTVFGGGPGNGVEDMAAVLDTIPYEVMTSVSQRVKRIYVKE